METMNDAELAMQLSRMCQRCERAVATDGYLLCDECYRRRRRPIPCENCNWYTADPICERCDAPTAYATYEDLLSWEARRAPTKSDASALDAYIPTTAANPSDECPICLQAFSHDNVVVTHCVHTFHMACLHAWVSSSVPLCPVCKTDVRGV